jgi:cobalamin biosynthesis protein CobD/CbiB
MLSSRHSGHTSIVTAIKSLWASVQGDPTFMRKVNGWFTIFWIVMIPISIMLGLLSSVAYVSALSLWALVSGHWSAWQAARVEVAQQAEQQAREDDPVERRVVEEIVKRTNLQETPNPTAVTDAEWTSLAQQMTMLGDLLAAEHEARLRRYE